MRPSSALSWARLYQDSWRLGLESSRMIEQRVAAIAEGGPVALTESVLMVTEKWHAAVELQFGLLASMTRASPLAASQHAVSFYRQKVAKNRRRLRRS